VDFTREPIIETIVTPKDGFKLVVRSSKANTQEEYFVDAVEIVSFGQALFFRSLERPKCFLVPVCDYEVLEVRETRMVLKNAGLDRAIKIGGGREGGLKSVRDVERRDLSSKEEGIGEEEKEEIAEVESAPSRESATEVKGDLKGERKRDRRRNYRKRKGVKEEGDEAKGKEEPVLQLEHDLVKIPAPVDLIDLPGEVTAPVSPTLFSSLLQPPPTLISETINRYRENVMFRSAFFVAEEEELYSPHEKTDELLNEEEDDEGYSTQSHTPIFDEPESEPKSEQEHEPEPEQESEVEPKPHLPSGEQMLSIFAEEGDPTDPET